MNYQNRFIAFIDILGFTSLIDNEKMSLDDVLEVLNNFSVEKEFNNNTYSPSVIVCPNSHKIEPTFDLRSTQISDSLIVSSEVSVGSAINLLFLCHRSIFKLAEKGLMCRGYITVGETYHINNQILGKAYIDACKKEKEIGIPIVAVDQKVCDYIIDSKDECAVKMFNRLTDKIESSTFLFPMKTFTHSYAITANTDLEYEKAQFDACVTILKNFQSMIDKYVDLDVQSALQKATFFKKLLDNLINENVRGKEMVNILEQPFP